MDPLVGMTPAQIARLRLALDDLGLAVWERLGTSPSLSLALTAGRALGWDPSASARIGTVAFADVSDGAVAVLAWVIVDRLLAAGVELSTSPTPDQIAAAFAELHMPIPSPIAT